MTERQILLRLKEIRNKSVKIDKRTDEDLKKIIDRKKRWCQYWRNNINLYIAYGLGINTFPYQHFSYYEMGEATTYFQISTRNTAKTFTAASYGNALCMIKPYSEVAFVSVTLGQSRIALSDKLLGEIFEKESMSKVMPFLYKEGYIKVKELESGWCLEYWNGSKMFFYPCLDSIRGKRLTCLILEECRLMKQGVIDSVFKPMLRPRNAAYKSLPKYLGRRDLDEEPQTIYITSNRYSHEWANKVFNETFVGYFKNKYAEDRIFCVDIYVALKHGLKSKKWFISEQKKMNKLDWDAEILNLDIGEADGAYFTREMFAKNQRLRNAWIPPTYEDIRNGIEKNRKKKINEKRIIFVDFAWVGDNGKIVNDQTVLGCMSLIPKSEKLLRNVEYIETYSGSKANDMPQRIKELFWWYKADYIVMDIRSSGEILYNQLSTPYEHPCISSQDWNIHGFTVCIENDLHMVTDAKLLELRGRTVDPEALPVIIPINSTSTFNSDMWIDLSTRLKNDEISFLIDELEFKTWFEEQKEWFTLTHEEKTTMILPYTQTMFLIHEAVNLSQEWREGKIYLKEPRSGTKDKIVATAYANAIATKIENKLAKQAQNLEFDISEWQLVF